MTKILNPFSQVLAFNLACGNKPGTPTGALSHTYKGLFDEEVSETMEGWDKVLAAKSDVELLDAVTELADGLLDTIYISMGWLHAMGLDPKPLWAEVQRSNMAKVDPVTGAVTKNGNGKILKPEGWTPPQLLPLVARQLGYVQRTSKDVLAQVDVAERRRKEAEALTAQVDGFDRLLTIQQAGAIFSMTDGWVRKQISDGKLEAKTLGPKTIRIPESSVKALLATL